mmetsp:Transcript_6492/g.22845  ORF Transcript_6492/g.22845 Transcript_6492/m.22845 type:complete len:886 (-) Transcript_6492:378-3035(-)
MSQVGDAAVSTGQIEMAPPADGDAFAATGKKNAGAQSSEQASGLTRLADVVNAKSEAAFNRLGRFAALSPMRTVGGALFFMVLMMTGLYNVRNESRGEKLWVPTESQAQDDKKFVDDHYPLAFRIASSVISTREKDGNVLTPAVLDAAFEVYQMAVSAEGEIDGSTVGLNYGDRCYRLGSNCLRRNILEVFDYDTNSWATEDLILAKLNAPLFDTNGEQVQVGEIIAGDTYDSSGSLVSATALSFTYVMRSTPVFKDGDDVDDQSDAWEQSYLEKMRGANEVETAPVKDIEVSYFASRSFSDEFGTAITGDIMLLQIAIIIIILFSSGTLSRFKLGWVGMRSGLTCMGLFSVGMAIGSSYGICSHFGLFMSPLNNMIPFLLLGIGVDDMFVLVNAVDLTDPKLPVEDRVGKALGTAGMSILLTSTTDFLAFLIGSTTTLPALSNFCIFAAFGIMFDFLYQVTFFTAFMAADLRRMNRNAKDCACSGCCTPQDMEQGAVINKALLAGPIKPSPRVNYAFTKIGEAMGNTWCKVAVCTTFAGLLAGGLTGFVQIEIKSDVKNFIPGGSYLLDFYDDAMEFSKNGPDLYVVSEDMALDTPEAWTTFENARTALIANQYVVASSVNSFLYDMQQTYALNAATFNADLSAFLQTPAGMRYNDDVVWNDETDHSKGVLTARMRARHVLLEGSKRSVKAMNSLRSDINDVFDDLFVYSPEYLEYEQYASIADEAVRNITVALAVMGFVVACFIVNPLGAASVFITLLMTVVNIVGYMGFWGLSIDSVTIIMLVMALGLSVDYSAHVGRAYMEKAGTANERIVATLSDMGTAVLNGGASTLLAVLVLGASQSYVFIVFFKQMILCTFFGLGHGLIFLPVLLGLLNPKPYSHAE